MLSKEYLLKEGYNFEVKTNVLNKNFYHELLYIMGLKETKREKNKIVIEIDHLIKNSLANQVYDIYVNDKGYNGTYHSEEEAVEKTFELIIIWINRLLFIKLFEGQLISFNSDDVVYHILDNAKIKSFNDLQQLFFNVLGKRERSTDEFYNQFNKIPYLNSSLFEQQDIERNDINIKEISNKKVHRSNKSVLGKRAPKELRLLEYIINFLNSYDFSARFDEEEQNNEKREIIDASVLGLIFEKLNGYKDGSVYTPSTITEYMCKQAIEKSVIDKINDSFKWNCKDLDDIRFNITSLSIAKEVNSIINSIKICDPAVGSGHFLVSALNRIIAIKAQLGVLFKHNNNDRLNEVDVYVLDDILCVVDGQGRSFVYNKNDSLSQQIQETLFNEKRIIIEEMLFGVDINSKAVHICQLRLWIELLKNAYYKNDVMETLPNIDINIKVGNSLINSMKFEIGKSISSRQNSNINKNISKYKTLVKEYQSTSDKIIKIRILSEIMFMKDALRDNAVQLDLSSINNSNKVNSYKGAFEWIYEFPSIIDSNGNFLGFDIVIGNPPYIQLQKMGEDSERLKAQNFSTFVKTGDIYCLFYERGYQLLKKKGILSFITSNKWMRAAYGEKLRGFLAYYTNPKILIDFSGSKIFDTVTVDTNILMFEKTKNQHNTTSCLVKEKSLNNLSVYVEQHGTHCDFSENSSWIILSSMEHKIREKIRKVGTPLIDWNISINYGIKTGFNEAFIITTEKKNELISADPKSAELIQPILRGKDIKRYSYTFNEKWLIAMFPSKHYNIDNYPSIKKHLLSFGMERMEQTGKMHTVSGNEIKARKKTNNKWYETQDSIGYWNEFNKQKIAYREISKVMDACLVDAGFTLNNKCYLITGEHLIYILSFLNSKLFTKVVLPQVNSTGGKGEAFLQKVYLVEPQSDIEEKIIQLYNQRADNPIETDKEIDKIFCELFDLNNEEENFILN